MEASTRVSASELRDYLGIIWRHKWIVILSVVIITAVATSTTVFFSTTTYASSTELLQLHTGLDRALLGTELFSDNSSQPERALETNAELIKSPEVVNSVNDELAGELGGEDASSLIDVSTVNQTDIIRITATDAQPALAADVANSFAKQFIAWRQNADQEILRQAKAPIEAQLLAIPAEQQDTAQYRSLSDKLASLNVFDNIGTSDLEVVKLAVASNSPVSPKPLRTGLIAFFASMFLGIGAALVRERLDTRLRTQEEITDKIDRPILATVPHYPGAVNGSLVTLTHPSGACSEAYRLLKTNLSYVEPDKEIKSIMVTSPQQGEGKSSTIANLAVTFARSGKRVIILEADLRRPVLYRYMGLENMQGLTNAIAGACSLREVLQMIEAKDISAQNHTDEMQVLAEPSEIMNGVKPIYCATSGPVPPNPGELVASSKFASLIEEASGYADYVLVDAPPLGLVGDAASMATMVDGVILVVRMAQTYKKSLDTIQRFMGTVPCNVLGTIVNNSEESRFNRKYEYYQYY